LGKCVVCGKETYKILFSDAVVKTYICSEKCLKEYFKPVKGLKTRVACMPLGFPVHSYSASFQVELKIKGKSKVR